MVEETDSADANDRAAKERPGVTYAVSKSLGSRANSAEPSLVVLPFQSFGHDAELEAIADGLVENLTTVLTRVPLLSITSRTGSFALKGRTLTLSEIRQNLGVDYVIDGSVQRLGQSIRANVQLSETQTASQAWAQQFDVTDDGQTVVSLVHAVLPRLEPQLVRVVFRALQNEDGRPSSRQLLLQAMSVLSLKGWHKESFREVGQVLRKSIAIEPGLALSHAYLSLIRGLGKRVGLAPDPESAARDAEKHAEIALDLEDMDSNVLGLAGCAFSDIGQTGRGIPLLKRAIDLNPNNAQAHAALGAAHLLDKDFALAAERLTHGIEISPLDGRLAVWFALLGIVRLHLGQLEQALSAAESGCQADRKNFMPRVVVAGIHLLLEDDRSARVALEDARRVKPDLSQGEMEHLIGPEIGGALERLRLPEQR